jgi:hypothetical protein
VLFASHSRGTDGVGKLLIDGKTIILQPRAWIGQRFPLLYRIVVNEDIDRGKWNVILLRRGDEVVAQYASSGESLLATVAFIYLNPCDQVSSSERRQGVVGCLRGGYNWIADTPVSLVLNNGIVEGVFESDDVFTQLSLSRSH